MESGKSCLRCCLFVMAILGASTLSAVDESPDLSGLPPEIQDDIRRSQRILPPEPTATTSSAAPTMRPPQLPVRCGDQLHLRYHEQPKCSAGRSKWTFNAETGRCEWFAHFGCQLKSGNVFSSRGDCETACVRGVQNPCSVTQCVPISPLYKSECLLVNDTACASEVLKRFASIQDETVRRMIAEPEIEVNCQAPVARCRNSGVNIRLPIFETLPVLESPSSSLPDYCHLLPDRGFCSNNSRGPRLSRVYYYSRRRNECKFMVYFGCGGNSNRFSNLADCHNACAL